MRSPRQPELCHSQLDWESHCQPTVPGVRADSCLRRNDKKGRRVCGEIPACAGMTRMGAGWGEDSGLRGNDSLGCAFFMFSDQNGGVYATKRLCAGGCFVDIRRRRD